MARPTLPPFTPRVASGNIPPSGRGPDIAAYHGAGGLWFIKQLTTGTTVSFAYGGSGFTLVNY